MKINTGMQISQADDDDDDDAFSGLYSYPHINRMMQT